MARGRGGPATLLGSVAGPWLAFTLVASATAPAAGAAASAEDPRQPLERRKGAA